MTVTGPGSGASRAVSLELVSERMLLGALRELDSATAARAAQERAEFLAAASLRFGASLDQELTYAAIAGVALPGLDAWCIVDVIEQGGELRRLAVVHPDEDRFVVARTLAERWTPAGDDPIGIPAIRRAGTSQVLSLGETDLVAVTARDAETRRIIEELGVGPLLVVAIEAHGELLGAITYVGRSRRLVYSAADVELADALATRCAQALEGARLYAAARAALAQAATSESEARHARADAEAARASAEAANKAKAQFLRTMSHELRTPLNAIGGYAQLIEMGIRGPVTPEHLSDVASIQRSQLHLLQLVNAVLQYAQIEARTLEFTPTRVSLRELTTDIERYVAPQLRAKALHFTHDAGDQPLFVLADAGKLRQIVLNLVGNAIKFTAAEGCITVRCVSGYGSPRDDQPDVVPMHAVQVIDTGIGIPAGKLESIFDPFVQVSGRELTSTDAGVGLGLAISRELARGMDGELTVASTIGQGSTFTLTLPGS